MFQHAPEGYVCPFCRVAQGTYDALTTPQDVISQDSLVTAFIAPRWWPNNEGHVLIIPNDHFENLYELPAPYAYRIHDLTQAIALAFKQVYRCHGVSTRQHNEPAGGQDVWHYHLHVFPRYLDDHLYHRFRSREIAPPDKRWTYAALLRTFLAGKQEE